MDSDVIGVMSSGLKSEILDRKTALQTGCLELERCLPDIKGLIRDALQLRCGICRLQCFWGLNHREYKSGHLGLHFLNFDYSFYLSKALH